MTSHGMEYNTSKIQHKILCRFCRNIDLEILYFYFSSENCSSKVYTTLDKVVVLVTLSTAKLGLQFFGFFVILYEFYKVQLKYKKGVRNLFATRPLNSFPPSQIYPRIAQNTLEVSGALQCGPRPMGAARPRGIPATSPATTAGECLGRL
jgi:hypothetical protein